MRNCRIWGLLLCHAHHPCASMESLCYVARRSARPCVPMKKSVLGLRLSPHYAAALVR